MAALFKTMTLLLIASFLVMVALLVPAQIRSIDVSVVELAGAKATSVEDKIWEELNAAYISSAQHYIKATQSKYPNQENYIKELLEKNPNFAISGGPGADFEYLLKRDATGGTPNNIISQLLPRHQRASLSEALATSHNRNVLALLDIRDLDGLSHLHPASHSAGAPYDAGLLTLALLIEGAHIQPTLSQQIRDLAILAAINNSEATATCEELIMDMLSLGHRLDYNSLASLAKLTKTLSNWSEMATLFRSYPDRTAELYTALRFSKAPNTLYTYLNEHTETGNRDLDFALRHGPGAVTYLINSKQAIYQASPISAAILDIITPYRPQSFTALTLHQNSLGQGLKFILLFFAGLAFAFATGSLWRSSLGNTKTLSRANPVIIMRDMLIGLTFALMVWAFFEPEILKSQKSIINTTPHIEFTAIDTLQSLKSPIKAMQELNQVTLLVLALFFIIQLAIYSFCLIKIKEISKQTLSSDIKLKLLENEDNLFDFGLYVGLGGTVLSLILVVIGIIEASLMAAYASTLFGILFTALLKVFHLRPYRRQLILKAEA